MNLAHTQNKHEKLQPKYKDAYTQTTSGVFDTTKCHTIPHDLHGWSQNKLNKLSINDLMILCQTRDINHKTAIRQICAQRLYEWKIWYKNEKNNVSHIMIPTTSALTHVHAIPESKQNSPQFETTKGAWSVSELLFDDLTLSEKAIDGPTQSKIWTQ